MKIFNTKKAIITIFLTLTALTLTTSAKFRTWTNNKGKTLSAELVSLTKTDVKIKLKSNRREITIPIDTLSDADKAFLKQWRLDEKKKLEEKRAAAFTIAGTKINLGQVTKFDISTKDSKGKTINYPAGLIVPKDFDPLSKDYNIVFTFITGGNNPVQNLKKHMDLLSVDNTIVAAVHHAGVGRTLPFSDFYRIISEKWPRMTENKWKQMHFGYSGGAKNGCWATGYFINYGANVVGCYLGGCNEDRTERAREYADSSAGRKKVNNIAFFLSAGMKDKIASPADHRRVMASIKKNGAKHVRMETHPGGHSDHKPHKITALKWMIDIAKKQENK